jgi:hypothetical protein
MQLYWEVANMFVEATAIEGEEGNIPKSAYQVGEQLVQAAEAMSVRAISNQSQGDVGISLPPMGQQPFPALPVEPATCVGVWAAYEAIYLQVQIDKSRLLSTKVPKRFQPVLQQLLQAISPAATLHEYFQGQWLIATSPESRLQIVRQAEEGAKALFRAGQNLWAPYQLGAVYSQCVNAKLTFDDLDLGFDPWATTDPNVRERRENDPRAIEELTEFWVNNPEPGKTYRLQQEILAAHQARAIRYMDGTNQTQPPWSSLWAAWRDVVIGGNEISAGYLFVLYAGPDGEGGFVSEARRAGRFRLGIR